MNVKILLLIIGGMSLSFIAVLSIMLNLLGDKTSSGRTTAPRRIVITEELPQRKPPAPAPRKEAPTRSTPQSATVSVAPPTQQSEQIPAPAQPTPTSKSEKTPAPTPLRPDPATLREFSTLKNELRREIGALQQDRDAMLRSLAAALADLPKADLAKEFQAIDDEMAAQTLRYFDADKRRTVLADLGTQRADKIRRHLNRLGVR